MSETRSVKIGDDERGGWSSDRPRRDGTPSGGGGRPVDISTRQRVLKVTDRLRYTPGSLVVVISASEKDRESFVDRVFIEDKNAILSTVRIRKLLEQKFSGEELEAKTRQLWEATIVKRLGNGDQVIVPIEGLDGADREALNRLAHAKRRPRHAIFLDTGGSDEERPALNELRNRLEGGDLGQEGFQTALRLSAGALHDLKRIVFRTPQRDDD